MDEKTLNEVLETLDIALTSDNPMIQKALKKFLFIVAMTNVQEDQPDQVEGPYTRLMRDIETLKIRVQSLELEALRKRSTGASSGTATVTNPYTYPGATGSSGGLGGGWYTSSAAPASVSSDYEAWIRLSQAYTYLDDMSKDLVDLHDSPQKNDK